MAKKKKNVSSLIKMAEKHFDEIVSEIEDEMDSMKEAIEGAKELRFNGYTQLAADELEAGIGENCQTIQSIIKDMND